MNEADVLARLRERFPSWSISVGQGMWRASGRLIIRSSSPEQLEAALNGEPPIPSRLASPRAGSPCARISASLNVLERAFLDAAAMLARHRWPGAAAGSEPCSARPGRPAGHRGRQSGT
ncbi:hypothetical protein E1293_33065 [Actinomadura darangshiensis]|uniref:Uncharacterized protein n=1 Tax=Actinomadura darangshiensis TaxID=705336 RepID=A0A4R5AKR2_9ACTN|nr:hypothetical protein [Actinomadura darangshiensis]TDD72156.1 hypothetical protein E1293_33065 [Actinomadura darangshiensis]